MYRLLEKSRIKHLLKNEDVKISADRNTNRAKDFVDSRPEAVAQRALQATLNPVYNKLVVQRETTKGYKEAEASAKKKPLPMEKAVELAQQMIEKAHARIEALRPKEEEEKREEAGQEPEKSNFKILNLMGTKKVMSYIQKAKISKSKGFNITTNVLSDDGKIMASFQNTYVAEKGAIIKMIAGANVKSKIPEEQPTGFDKEPVPINMNEILHLQFNIARRALRMFKSKKTDLEALSKDQGVGLKDLPFVIERGPTPGTDTANALRFLIQQKAPEQDLIFCVIGSPHFSVAFHICRELGLSMDNVDITFEKDNPVITLHL